MPSRSGAPKGPRGPPAMAWQGGGGWQGQDRCAAHPRYYTLLYYHYTMLYYTSTYTRYSISYAIYCATYNAKAMAWQGGGGWQGQDWCCIKRALRHLIRTSAGAYLLMACFTQPTASHTKASCVYPSIPTTHTRYFAPMYPHAPRSTLTSHALSWSSFSFFFSQTLAYTPARHTIRASPDIRNILYIRICVYMCIYVNTCMYMCIYIYIYIHIYIQCYDMLCYAIHCTYLSLSLYIYIYTYIYIYMYVCVYIYIYIYMCARGQLG